MAERVTIRNSHLSATIDAKGAELVSLIPAGGEELMWSADPAIWPWHAPNLFPIVGALADDTLIHQGRRYPMKQHGFLRHSVCAIVAEEADFCAFRLTDSDATREQYPFAFDLTLLYRLDGDRLDITFELRNPASTSLHASLGAHPGFCWPLGAAAADAHVIRFDQPEPAPIRRLAGRLLDPASIPSPVVGDRLTLDPALFDHDALIFDRLEGRRLVYGAPGGLAIELSFADFPQFGIWTRPGGAPFLCLEPWQGHATPADFAGEFADKPGVVALAAGETRGWRYSIRPLASFPD